MDILISRTSTHFAGMQLRRCLVARRSWLLAYLLIFRYQRLRSVGRFVGRQALFSAFLAACNI